MHSILIRRILSLSALAAFALPASASQLDAVLEHLDRDGQFLLFMDHTGDAQTIGKAMNSLQASLARVIPEMGMVQVDFAQVFSALGLDSVAASGFSSAYVGAGVHRNRAITLYTGEPTGLMRIIPPDNRDFAVLDLASATTDLAYELILDAKVLHQVASEIAFGAMGSMGAGLLEMQLQQPLTPLGPTVAQILEMVTNHFAFTLEYPANDELNASSEPEFVLMAKEGDAIWSFVGGFAEIVEGLTLHSDEDWTWYRPGPLMDQPESDVILARKTSGGPLYLASSRSFLDRTLKSGSSLRTHPEFKAFADQLPTAGNAFYFQSARMSRINLMAALQEEGAVPAEFAPVLVTLMEGPLSKFLGGGVGTYRSVPNGSESVSFSNVSYKDVAYLAAATVPAVITAAAYFAIQNQASTDAGMSDDDWGDWEDWDE